jgi:hypothetical protein
MMLKFIQALAVLVITSNIALAQNAVPTQWVLYKNGGQPLPSNPKPYWSYEATAYTAITVPAPFNVWKAQGAKILDARVQAVWHAMSLYANTGVGLMICPSQHNIGITGFVGCSLLVYFAANDTVGPASYTPGCSPNPGGPFPCGAIITPILQNLIDRGVAGMYFVLVTYGNGNNGPAVWDFEIFITWG